MYITRQAVKKVWKKHRSGQGLDRDALKKQIKEIDKKIEQFMDRIVETDSATLVKAYEAKITKMEFEKASISSRLASSVSGPLSFEESFQTVFDFIENPQKLWHSEDLEDRRLVLKLVFTRPLAYHRKEGFQTAAIALPFKVSRGFMDGQSEMVVGSGVGANLLVDFVDALYDVGRIFESPMIVEDKQFKFQPMQFPTKSPSLSKRTYEQWQEWFEETIEKQKMAA